MGVLDPSIECMQTLDRFICLVVKQLAPLTRLVIVDLDQFLALQLPMLTQKNLQLLDILFRDKVTT